MLVWICLYLVSRILCQDFLICGNPPACICYTALQIIDYEIKATPKKAKLNNLPDFKISQKISTTKLILRDNNITSFPEELFKWNSLKVIDLSNNPIECNNVSEKLLSSFRLIGFEKCKKFHYSQSTVTNRPKSTFYWYSWKFSRSKTSISHETTGTESEGTSTTISNFPVPIRPRQFNSSTTTTSKTKISGESDVSMSENNPLYIGLGIMAVLLLIKLIIIVFCCILKKTCRRCFKWGETQNRDRTDIFNLNYQSIIDSASEEETIIDFTKENPHTNVRCRTPPPKSTKEGKCTKIKKPKKRTD